MTSFRPDIDRTDFETLIQGRIEEWKRTRATPPDWLRCGRFLFLRDSLTGTHYTTELVEGADRPDPYAGLVAAAQYAGANG